VDQARVIGLISTFLCAFAVGLIGVWLAEEYRARSTILLVAGIIVIGIPVALLFGQMVKRALGPKNAN